MLRKALKWIGIVLGGLVGLLLAAALVLYALGNSKLNKTYNVEPEQVELPADEASLERGEFLVEGCRGCHGENLGGQLLFEEPGMATVYSANLTTGRGGMGSQGVNTLVLAIRHGVDHDGTGVVFMPAHLFNNFSREDLGAVIAYLKSVEPVDNTVPQPEFSFIARIMIGAGVIPASEVFPASLIDHDRPFVEMPEIGVNQAYGAYMARVYGCTICHGENLAGRQLSFPSKVRSANLTPAGELAHWSEQDFIQTLRTGITPDGRRLNPEYMVPLDEVLPITEGHLRDLSTIWVYLQSLPPTESPTE